MERLAITRGEHPNEAVAFVLAPKIAEVLESYGYDITLVSIPLTATTFGSVLKDKKTYDRNWLRNVFRETGARYIFSIHNNAYPEWADPFIEEVFHYQSGERRVVVEIPAIFRPLTNPNAVEKVYGYINTSESGKKQREYYAKHWMFEVTNIPASTEEGLMSDNVIEIVADRMHQYITKLGEENEN